MTLTLCFFSFVESFFDLAKKKVLGKVVKHGYVEKNLSCVTAFVLSLCGKKMSGSEWLKRDVLEGEERGYILVQQLITLLESQDFCELSS